MKTTQALLAGALLASPFLLALGPAADSVVFAPKDGTSLTKKFTLTQKFNVDDMSMSMNGEEFPMEMEMDMDMNQSVTVSDTYDKMGTGKPALLTREYKDASMEMEVEATVVAMGQEQNQDQSLEGTSELTGKKVIFKWNDESSAYDTKFHEDTEGEDELLVDLLEDMDLRGLLPAADKEVDVDDEWSPEMEVLADLFAAGGNLKWEFDGSEAASAMGGPDPQTMSNLRALLSDSVEGDFTCKYVGLKEVDGKNLQRIEVMINIKSTADLLGMMEDAMGDQELPPGVNSMEMSQMDMDTTLEGKGVLLWNGEAGHIHSFEYEGSIAMAMDMGMAMEAGGQSMEMEMNMEMSGDMKLNLTTE